ncbi:hypothetical protein PCCS19_30480 [Paenibacillus sp. CCS19]|uniref:hypothetical protein n=1 Tax=Paenibacillus sp. CCS19 TaxID=3158387 RepID=UPI002564CC87|nr:hypothetical protein [Paenibacillus cellulosilyticus]GMK39993.1 hypothetical protein PCCS19_30480 [Paenibacillus cellulosilyticus]
MVRRDLWLGWAGGAIVLVVVVLVALTAVKEQREQPANVDGHQMNEVDHPELEKRNEQSAVTDQSAALDNSDEEMTFPQEVKLTFQPLADSELPILKVLRSSIAPNDHTRTIESEGKSYWIYAKPNNDDSTERFIGYAAGDYIYELGTIGGDVYEKDVAIDQVDLFGNSYARILGACGANCAVEHYVRYEDGIPVRNLYFNAHTQLVDWNHDGINELVYTDSGMPIHSILVRFSISGDQLEAVNLAELLQAKGGVIYSSESNTFKAYIPFSDKPAEYAYESGDRLVQNVK